MAPVHQVQRVPQGLIYLLRGYTGNNFAYPPRTVLDRLKTFGDNVFRTDTDGSIVALSDGETVKFNVHPLVNRKSDSGSSHGSHYSRCSAPSPPSSAEVQEMTVEADIDNPKPAPNDKVTVTPP